MLKQYRNSAPKYTSVGSAKSEAERRRKAGSYFVIEDTPALAFGFGKQSLVIVQLNTSTPFKKWSIPASLVKRRSPASGENIVQSFSGEHWWHPNSGWMPHGTDPDVLIGITETSSLSLYVEEQDLCRRTSGIQSGSMYFTSEEIVEAPDTAAIDRIAWDMGQHGLTKNQTEPRRLRVHQLAAQLEVQSKTILAQLEGIGSPAKGARSWLEPDTVEAVRLRLLDGRAEPAP